MIILTTYTSRSNLFNIIFRPFANDLAKSKQKQTRFIFKSFFVLSRTIKINEVSIYKTYTLFAAFQSISIYLMNLRISTRLKNVFNRISSGPKTFFFFFKTFSARSVAFDIYVLE